MFSVKKLKKRELLRAQFDPLFQIICSAYENVSKRKKHHPLFSQDILFPSMHVLFRFKDTFFCFEKNKQVTTCAKPEQNTSLRYSFC